MLLPTWLVAQKADVVLLKESLKGKGSMYVFGDVGVELCQTDADVLDEAIGVRLVAGEAEVGAMSD